MIEKTKGEKEGVTEERKAEEGGAIEKRKEGGREGGRGGRRGIWNTVTNN